MKKNVSIDEATARKMYKTADANWKLALEETFGKAFFSEKITDRVNTIADVFEIAGREQDEIIAWKKPKNKAQRSQNALGLIQMISEVYNEGEVLDFTNSKQRKYYIWWDKSSGSWVVFSCYGYSVCTDAAFGTFFKSEELARDVAKKFQSIFEDYLP